LGYLGEGGGAQAALGLGGGPRGGPWGGGPGGGPGVGVQGSGSRALRPVLDR
jgi:hypothetical protein